MGNQLTAGGNYCSTTPNNSLLAERFMEVKDFRIDYRSAKIFSDIEQRTKNRGLVAHQQKVGYQQQEQEEEKDLQQLKVLPKPELKIEIKQSEQKVYEGIYGDVVPSSDGYVFYTCNKGMYRCDVFIPSEIVKTFPMGISLGGLTKTIWFEDIADRNACFDIMAECHASATEVQNIPAYPKQSEEVDADDDNCKSFDGILGNNVVVYADNQVVYTDVDNDKHRVSYKRAKIKKCHPTGICFGGLPRTIWLKNEMERDLCFMLMQFEGEDELEKEKQEKFPGLYGSVIVKPDYFVEFTSLCGDRVDLRYDSDTIRQVFPMGITSMELSCTIWFREMDDCERCFEAMKQRC